MTRRLKTQKSAPRLVHTLPTGPEMQSQLKQAGIPAQKVVRRRDTGHYIADFFVPGMSDPVKSSAVWARSIEQHLGLTVINISDTVAAWRADKPIIWASVTFTISQADRPEPPRAA